MNNIKPEILNGMVNELPWVESKIELIRQQKRERIELFKTLAAHQKIDNMVLKVLLDAHWRMGSFLNKHKIVITP